MSTIHVVFLDGCCVATSEVRGGPRLRISHASTPRAANRRDQPEVGRDESQLMGEEMNLEEILKWDACREVKVGEREMNT